MTTSGEPEDEKRGKEVPMDGGDQIHVGDIKDAKGVAIGPGATAIVIEYISKGEEPGLFIGVPGFPRFGLVGRDPLLRDVVARLTAGGAVSLSTSGKGGVGKTALAVAVANQKELLDHFSDGVLWASVGPEGDPMLELSRWAETLKLDPTLYPEQDELRRALKNKIGQRKFLLVLDDIWDPADADALRCGGPFSAHLLTTRDNAIAGGFGGDNSSLNVPDLEPEPAFELLKRIAPNAVSTDPTLAREIVERVGGLPLAVELLGGYLTEGGEANSYVFPELGRERLEAMEDTTALLRRTHARLGDTFGRAWLLEDVLALSLEGFNVEELKAFHALGAFAPKPAVFSREAAEAVSGADGRFLNRLANRNLLEIQGGELMLHQILHAQAREHMDEVAQTKHAAYYLALVNEDRNNWQRIDSVYEQVRWAWQNIKDDDLLEWIKALRIHQEIRGLWREKIEWHNRGLIWATINDNVEDKSYFLVNLGWAYRVIGRTVKALVLLEEALLINREIGDRAGEAETLNNMGVVYRAKGQGSNALKQYENALTITREIGDRVLEGRTLNNMGMAYYATGQPARALEFYKESLTIRREMGDRAGEETVLSNMGMVYYATGQPVEALELFEEALPITREVADRVGEATTLTNMGLTYYATERSVEALALYEEALTIMREVGDRAREAVILNNMALVYRDTEQQAEAMALFEAALAIMREAGDRAGEAVTLRNVADVLRKSARNGEAIARMEEAVFLFKTGLTHDLAGDTVESYLEFLQELQEAKSGE